MLETCVKEETASTIRIWKNLGNIILRGTKQIMAGCIGYDSICMQSKVRNNFSEIIELEKIVAESMNKYKSCIFEKSKPNHKLDKAV